MDLNSYILFPSRDICQGKSFKRHAQLSISPPVILAGKETIELIAINCSSIRDIPSIVCEIASTTMEQPLSDENLFNALWSNTCSRHLCFKPFGAIKPEYLEDVFKEKNINLKSDNYIYIAYEKETMDIVSKVTKKKLQQNQQ